MRYIDADKFIEWLDVGHLRSPSEICMSKLDVKQAIELQPIVNVAPVIHAHWEKQYPDSDCGLLKCSHCGYEYLDRIECDDYCGNCGAVMDEVENDI